MSLSLVKQCPSVGEAISACSDLTKHFNRTVEPSRNLVASTKLTKRNELIVNVVNHLAADHSMSIYRRRICLATPDKFSVLIDAVKDDLANIL
ncbi:hypothetical protein tloyanaT_13430 [Thalassotalea loyana]|uniref:Uncharacterized protein n=1 Tax=Thalassotalea loyana TaxID=280483 RepID=A0ABQ6HAE1_9GAMM|nr:hypothetical protein [Thalassotalea loyana]GLX85091.1 hypothetical protein tloyanaT_13430 [Thalassotalea loyana]